MTPSPDTTATGTPEIPRYTLPNGLSIAHVNKHETDFLYKELFEERAYFKHGITLGDAPCVFDIGANIGMFSLCVKQACPGATIYAFEPTPALHRVLQLNVADFGASVKPLQCGVSDRDGEATFTYYPDYSIMSGFHADAAEDSGVLASGIRNQLLSRPARGGQVPDEYIDRIVQQKLGTRQEFNCPLRSVSSIIREYHVPQIDLLKVDAERSELPILRGIEEQDWPKIRQVVMEVHDAESLEVVRQILTTHGFQITVEQEGQFAQSGVFNCFATRPQ